MASFLFKVRDPRSGAGSTSRRVTLSTNGFSPEDTAAARTAPTRQRASLRRPPSPGGADGQ